MSGAPLFFRVRNFEKFQHYADRRPPWIKLYRDLWDDPRFFSLSDTDRYILIGLFVIASQHDNKVIADQKWLRSQLLTTKPIPLQLFIDTGWMELLEQDASNTLAASTSLADRYPSRARGETETEVQRQNTETEGNTPIPPLANLGEFGNVRLSAAEYEKLKVKLNGRLDEFINRLDRWGAEEPVKFRKKKSHYATILNWSDRDEKENQNGHHKTKSDRTAEAAERVLRRYNQKDSGDI